MIVADTGYDITRLAYVLADLPVELVGRLCSDRVLRLPKPPRLPGTNGRPPRHGPEIALDKPPTWPTPQLTTRTETTRYGTAVATSWDRVHPRLTRRGCWIDHTGELSIIEGTLIRLQVEHLPADRDPKPVWLWTSATAATATDVDRWWQAFLRRFASNTPSPTWSDISTEDQLRHPVRTAVTGHVSPPPSQRYLDLEVWRLRWIGKPRSWTTRSSDP